jgi:hypothetical protein
LTRALLQLLTTALKKFKRPLKIPTQYHCHLNPYKQLNPKLVEDLDGKSLEVPAAWLDCWSEAGVQLALSGSSIVPYRAALNIGADTQGLHLSMFPLLRIGAPALLIPWRQLTVAVPEDGSARNLEFRFRAAPSVFLRINKDLAAAILAHRSTNLPV